MTNRHSILLLMISIAFASAEEFLSDNVFPDKRSSMGLPGVHGKNNLAPWDHEELSKRAPMGFQGMRGKKSSIMAEVDGELFPEETKKRAPMGFQGMRGKKNNLLMTDYGDTYLHDDYEKRAPMGFQGMRGKKSLKEIFDEINKRTTAKRDDAAIGETYLLDDPDDSDKRSSPMDTYESIRDKKIRFLREWEKKAPMGFQGMRGKKMILDTLEELNKGSVMDFQGKKDTLDNYLEYPINPFDYERWNADLQDTGKPGESFKRARMDFHGMRSKRDATDVYRYNSSYARTGMGYQGISNRGNNLAAYEIEKRSPFGYLSVRDKKNPRWEFRGKFVGVRGKKSSVSQAARQGQPVF